MPEAPGYCWHCRHTLDEYAFARTAECPACGRQTHVCRNCRFYQPGLHNDCREPVADAVKDKDRANFCDYFSPNPEPPAPKDDPDDLLAAAEALFGGDKP